MPGCAFNMCNLKRSTDSSKAFKRTVGAAKFPLATTRGFLGNPDKIVFRCSILTTRMLQPLSPEAYAHRGGSQQR
jgi:hypothetical protein